jgi:hypothetical protein
MRWLLDAQLSLSRERLQSDHRKMIDVIDALHNTVKYRVRLRAESINHEESCPLLKVEY